MWRTDSLEKTLMLGKTEGRRRKGQQRIRWLCCSDAQLCPTLCDPMDCSRPGSPALHRLQEFARTRVVMSRWCYQTISSSVIPFFCLQDFPASGSFPMSQFFSSGGQSTGASVSVIPMNTQGLFPLGFTGLFDVVTFEDQLSSFPLLWCIYQLINIQ